MLLENCSVCGVPLASGTVEIRGPDADGNVSILYFTRSPKSPSKCMAHGDAPGAEGSK